MSIEAAEKKLLSEIKKAIKLAKQYEKTRSVFAKDFSRIEKKLKKCVPIEFEMDGIIKDYKEAVKNSNGLTNMLPSIVKALDAAHNKPTKGNLEGAAKLVDAHAADIEKKNKDAAKTDKKLAATLKSFLKDLGDLATKLRKHDAIAG
jgi:hypothetical protein